MNLFLSANLENRCFQTSLAQILAITATSFMLQGCLKKETVAVSVTGYNHIENESILGFSVNGASGPNISPYGGGNKFSCCVRLPKHWKPGLKATVHWQYGSGPNHTPPPPQSATVEIPQYTAEDMGTLQVHFYPNHKIKVLSTQYGLRHPMNPLSPEERAPWEIDESVVRVWQWQLEQQRLKEQEKGEK